MMEGDMKATGKMISSMGSGPKHGPTATNTREIINMVTKREKGSISGKMEVGTPGTGPTIVLLEVGFMSGQTEGDTMEIG